MLLLLHGRGLELSSHGMQESPRAVAGLISHMAVHDNTSGHLRLLLLRSNKLGKMSVPCDAIPRFDEWRLFL